MSRFDSVPGFDVPTGGFELLRVPSRLPLYRADPDRVFELLAGHQFEDPVMAARELYANALDACRGHREGRIEIAVDARRVVVEDDGDGLDAESLVALTTLGRTTRKTKRDLGRFGIGFASVFDPSLGVDRVEVQARRRDGEAGVHLNFRVLEGAVDIEERPSPAPPLGGTRVEVYFDAQRAPADRVRRFTRMFEIHAAYSGVPTWLDGRTLGRPLQAYISDRAQQRSGSELELISSSAVRGAVGVAAVDPTASEVEFRLHQGGLFVCTVQLPRDEGKPWIRGGFGIAEAEGLSLVASRNGFVRDEGYERLLAELRRLHQEASYRVVTSWERSRSSYARAVLIDALRRGLKVGNRELLLAACDDLFSGAVVRAPLFKAWGEAKGHSFEELAERSRKGVFKAQSFRPRRGLREETIFRADSPSERDIFRRLDGRPDMPSAARSEDVARPTLWTRIQERFLTGPAAEYSLFDRTVPDRTIPTEVRALVDAAERFIASPGVVDRLERMLPGALPRFGFGVSGNAFGPVAAHREGEIRFNVRHRVIRRLAAAGPKDGLIGLLPVLAHELAHVCHELHDLDFYRTSRALLRALSSAAVEAS
ncbi:MAG: ATP-binding protein [Myxococcota bacterium]